MKPTWIDIPYIRPYPIDGSADVMKVKMTPHEVSMYSVGDELYLTVHRLTTTGVSKLQGYVDVFINRPSYLKPTVCITQEIEVYSDTQMTLDGMQRYAMHLAAKLDPTVKVHFDASTKYDIHRKWGVNDGREVTVSEFMEVLSKLPSDATLRVIDNIDVFTHYDPMNNVVTISSDPEEAGYKHDYTKLLSGNDSQ